MIKINHIGKGSCTLRQKSGQMNFKQKTGTVLIRPATDLGEVTVVYQLDFSKDYNSQYINVIL